MSPSDWPPPPHHPVDGWTDDELIDQYRVLKAEFGTDVDYLDTDKDFADLIQELIRRGLDDFAEAAEEDQTPGGRVER